MVGCEDQSAVVLWLRRYYVLTIGWMSGQTGGAILNVTLKNAFGTFVFCGLGAYLLRRV
jgi:hypothetical protein